MGTSRLLRTVLALAIGTLSFPGLPATAQDAQSIDEIFGQVIQAQDPDQAIDLGTAALTFEKAERNWDAKVARDVFRTDVHSALGRAYINRTTGIRADNVEAAIENFTAALSAASSSAPAGIAGIHTNLAIAYWNRIRGEERALSHFETALKSFDRKNHPVEWAQISSNLGVLYLTRLRGDRASNIERSIESLEGSLEHLDRDAQAQLWATAHSNLGNAYRESPTGSLRQNLAIANSHFEQALKVFTRDRAPFQWAQLQLSMFAVLRRRGGSDEEENAIDKLHAALEVFTRDAYPQQWAETQTNSETRYPIARVAISLFNASKQKKPTSRRLPF